MSEIITDNFVFIWAGIVTVSFIVWIILTAREMNDIVEKREKK
tara:strand:+ start:1085 stop:1213 length:129 start_codon:yes stop_codon:yes gene_type:complete